MRSISNGSVKAPVQNLVDDGRLVDGVEEFGDDSLCQIVLDPLPFHVAQDADRSPAPTLERAGEGAGGPFIVECPNAAKSGNGGVDVSDVEAPAPQPIGETGGRELAGGQHAQANHVWIL